MKNKQVRNPVRSTRWRRLVRLLAAAVCFVILSWVAVNTNFQGHQVLYQQGYAQAQRLTSQIAMAMAYPMEQNDRVRMSALIKQLAQEPMMQSAALFDAKGVLQAATDSYVEYDPTAGISLATPGISKITQPIVIPVHTSETSKPLGFVRVNYLPQSAIEVSHRYFHEMARQVLLMILITCVFTWQLGRGLKRWQFRRYFRSKAKALK